MLADVRWFDNNYYYDLRLETAVLVAYVGLLQLRPISFTSAVATAITPTSLSPRTPLRPTILPSSSCLSPLISTGPRGLW